MGHFSLLMQRRRKNSQPCRSDHAFSPSEGRPPVPHPGKARRTAQRDETQVTVNPEIEGMSRYSHWRAAPLRQEHISENLLFGTIFPPLNAFIPRVTTPPPPTDTRVECAEHQECPCAESWRPGSSRWAPRVITECCPSLWPHCVSVCPIGRTAQDLGDPALACSSASACQDG